MCRIAFIEDGPECETQGELASALEVPLIYLDGTPDGAKGDAAGCLCWVDVPATCLAAGFRAVDANGDWHVRTSLRA